MAEDISNKTLAVLVGLAIIISLAGIIFAPKGGVITGRAPQDTGTASVDVLGYLGVDVLTGYNAINFGNITLSGVGAEYCL